jgi:hypothetical protein
MTTHSHTHRLMHLRTGQHPGRDGPVRLVLHPRMVLFACLVAVTIMVAMSYGLRTAHESAPASQPTAAWSGNQGPPGIWASRASGPVK